MFDDYAIVIGKASKIRGPRVVIAGGPKTGKTTLGRRVKTIMPLLEVDDLIDQYGWSELSQEVANRMDLPGPWVIEGTATVRALRKWLAANDGKPCDIAVYLKDPCVSDMARGQVSMGKSCLTIWNEIRGDLEARGVDIVE